MFLTSSRGPKWGCGPEMVHGPEVLDSCLKSRLLPVLKIMNKILTKSSNISLWWTWMVMRVSYLVLSTGSRSFVVMSINVLSISRKYWLVLAITRRSCRAFTSASSESLVHIIWIPSNPTWGRIFGKNIKDIRVKYKEVYQIDLQINSNELRSNNIMYPTTVLSNMQSLVKSIYNFDIYLSRKGVEEVNKLKFWVLGGQGSLSNHRVQRTLRLLQKRIKPNFYIPFCHDRMLQLYTLSFTWCYSHNTVIYLWASACL